MPSEWAVKKAAENADWQQVVQNGGPPCFHLEDDARFCLRAERWEGHEYPQDFHAYASLDSLLDAARKQGRVDGMEEAAAIAETPESRDVCLRIRARIAERKTPRYTEAQKSAIAKAIFDNDYAEMNQLKAKGEWIAERKKA